MNPTEIRAVIGAAATDQVLITGRFEVARLATNAFKNLGTELSKARKYFG